MRLLPAVPLACLASLLSPATALATGARQDEPAQFKTFVRQVIDLDEPASCAFFPDGSMVVLEALTAQLRRYGPDGKETGAFGSRGSDEGQMLDPGDVEIHAGLLYVADTGNHRVQVFGADGKPVRAFGGFGPEDGRFNDPRGLDVANDRIAVADARNDRVQVFDLEGKHLLSFGTHGHGDGELNLPVDVTFDADGNLFVVDGDNHRVQKFDGEGGFVKAWGDFGPFPGLFVAPSAIDYHDGLLYVTDTDNSRIQVFDTQGERKYEWGDHSLRPREGDGFLHYPSHAKISPAGDQVVVIERFENRLQVYRRVRPDDPETLARIDNLILAHLGGSLDAAGPYVALVEPARPEVQMNQIVNGRPVKIASVETHGRRPGQLLRPVDVALDLERRRLYCSDPANMRLLVFGWQSREGKELGFDRRMLRLLVELDFVALFEPEGATLWPIEPGALELDGEGRLHMCDPRNRVVWAFTPALAIERSYGGYETLQRPVDLDFTGDGKRLLVVDELAQRVVTFGIGQPVQGSFGGEVFRRLAGICVDGEGNVFLTDAGRHKLFKFGPDLKFVEAWGAEEDQPGLGRLEFFKPTGITQDGEGNLIVLDFGNHRGQILSTAGEFEIAFGPRLFVRPANRP